VSIDSARKAARRYSKICTGFNETARIKEIFDAYRDEANRCGLEATPDHLALRRRVVVAETQDDADEKTAGVKQRIREMVSKDPRATFTAASGKLGADKPVLDAGGGGFTVSEDEFISGTPSAVAEQIVEQCRHTGAGHFLSVLHWGAPFAEVSRGHEFFGTEVIPLLR
jgi:alkanesulfonate monooxygenase SsuD/methylene tetrahydromethanopterin reductase-like flavin-dependent oxidoreductase (luciferase family)